MSDDENKKLTITQQVEAINAQLRAFGREAVQEIKMMKDGKVIGQVRYGYKPQYVFDAVNNVLLPENWRYEVVSKEIYDNQVVAEGKLFRRTQEEWFCKGSKTGQMQIIKKNVGDAMKGAITDALQKCFSLLSIGSDAYKGLLKDVYFSDGHPSATTAGQQPQRPPQKPGQPDADQSTNDDLPKIAGIKYQRRNGIIVALGNSFDKKELLKSAGFRWDGAGKHWYKEAVPIQ
jgi:hypothetical protein